jgi:hypothetical protein
MEGVETGTLKQVDQELMTFDDIKMLLDANLRIGSHSVPDGMVGNLYCIEGIYAAAIAIFKTLERRSKLFKGHTKPQEE